MKSVKTVALYVYADDSPPLAQQLRMMRAYARRHRWEVVQEFVETPETSYNTLKALVASIQARQQNTYIRWHDVLNRPTIGPVICDGQKCQQCSKWDACHAADLKRRLCELRESNRGVAWLIPPASDTLTGMRKLSIRVSDRDYQNIRRAAEDCERTPEQFAHNMVVNGARVILSRRRNPRLQAGREHPKVVS
jgi:hypothetical protein